MSPHLTLTRVALISHQHLALGTRSDLCVKSSSAHPEDSQGFRSGLSGGECMCENDVTYSLNHRLSPMTPGGVVLERAHVREEKPGDSVHPAKNILITAVVKASYLFT